MLRQFLIICLFCISAPGQAGFDELAGRVVDVVDGDTIYIEDSQGKRRKIYLLGIEAPQPDQPFAKKARAQLEHLLFARNDQVRVIVKKRTRAGNYIGTVYAAYQNSNQFADINGMMVMSGFAWANQRTSKQYIAAERVARKRKTGLWKQKNPIAPWKWKRQIKK